MSELKFFTQNKEDKIRRKQLVKRDLRLSIIVKQLSIVKDPRPYTTGSLITNVIGIELKSLLAILVTPTQWSFSLKIKSYSKPKKIMQGRYE